MLRFCRRRVSRIFRQLAVTVVKKDHIFVIKLSATVVLSVELSPLRRYFRLLFQINSLAKNLQLRTEHFGRAR